MRMRKSLCHSKLTPSKSFSCCVDGDKWLRWYARGVYNLLDIIYRCIENPRIVLLDCPLEYKKGESQTNVEMSSEADFSQLLKLEEEYVQKMCNEIIAVKPDLVFTEKGVSGMWYWQFPFLGEVGLVTDLAQHFLMKHNITAIRRLRKSDNNRIARYDITMTTMCLATMHCSMLGYQGAATQHEKLTSLPLAKTAVLWLQISLWVGV